MNNINKTSNKENFENLTNDYMGSKYSEFIYPKGKVMESYLDEKANKEQKAASEKNKIEFWKMFERDFNSKFKRPCTLGKNKNNNNFIN